MTEIATQRKSYPESIPLFVKTNKQFISGLPRFMYTGPIQTIIGADTAERAVSVLRKSRLLGIDTETRPSFRKGESHKVALLQISTEELCFLFRLNRIGFPQCLIDLLSDESILKVGLSLKDDFHMLRARHPFSPKGFIDLQDFVKEMGIEDMSLQNSTPTSSTCAYQKCPFVKLGSKRFDRATATLCSNRRLRLFETL